MRDAETREYRRLMLDWQIVHNRMDNIIFRELRRLNNMAQALQDQLDLLAAQVAADTDATNSAVTLLSSLLAKLDAVLASGVDAPAQVQQVADLTAAFKANTDALAAAVVANTPAQP